jgi:molecular chaperone GrpE
MNPPEPITPQATSPQAGTPPEEAVVANSPPATPPETMPDPMELLRQMELKVEEHHDAWLRAKAETENVRRRAQDDIAKASKFAIERFAGDLLAVRDALEAALGDPNPTLDNVKAGVELTLKQLTTAFDRASLVPVNPAGEKFDPHRHQAVTMVDSDKDANTVVDVFQKGYLIGERVLRPAMVTVAKPK